MNCVHFSSLRSRNLNLNGEHTLYYDMKIMTGFPQEVVSYTAIISFVVVGDVFYLQSLSIIFFCFSSLW